MKETHTHTETNRAAELSEQAKGSVCAVSICSPKKILNRLDDYNNRLQV